jgi:hypothetical protein
LDAINEKHYLCNPNEKAVGKKRGRGEEERESESKGNELENKM